MSANTLETRSRLIEQDKEQSRRDLSVSINSITVLIAAFGLLLGGLAFFAAFSAHQQTAVYTIWVRDFHADMKANGYDVPLLPEEKE